MARLRQQHPQNYVSSGNISQEFENLIRYLNAAERGNKTVGELIDTLFDADGQFDGPIELRQDSTKGLQYRVGEYTDPEAGWQTLATIDELRGPAGQDVGTIGAPIFQNRLDENATSGQTVFDYVFDSTTDEVVVFVDGVLQRPGGGFDYVADDTAGSNGTGAVTFNSGLSTGQLVTIYTVRVSAVTGYKREDFVAASGQTVFPFVHNDTDQLQVYRNGILQKAGGASDYNTDAGQNTVTFTSALSAGEDVAIFTVQNVKDQVATGLMTEKDYTDLTTGLILFSKIAIADGAIPQVKVNGLAPALASAANLTVSATTPSNPATGDLWLDISQVPNQLKFYDGTQWLRTSPESSLPTFSSSNAGQVIKVNGTGTGLIFDTVDLSSVIPKTQKGAANGVATLDSSGKLPASQLPSVLSTDSLFKVLASTVTNGDYVHKRIYKQRVRIDGLHAQTSAGTCDLIPQVNGVDAGSTYTISSSPLTQTLGSPIEIDATTTAKTIGFRVANVASAADLEVTFAVSVIGS